MKEGIMFKQIEVIEKSRNVERINKKDCNLFI